MSFVVIILLITSFDAYDFIITYHFVFYTCLKNCFSSFFTVLLIHDIYYIIMCKKIVIMNDINIDYDR